MADMFLAESNPVAATFIALGMVVAILLFLLLGNRMAAWSAGWSELVKAFPANKLEMTGDTFKNQTAYIRKQVFNRAFKVQLGTEGVRLQPSFARRSPIFVPWSKIEEVVVPVERVFGFEQNIHLNVDWFNRLYISLPKGALAAVEKRVPADRIQKVDSSPSSIFKTRWSGKWGNQIK
jgi:hypothetical protein